jgi:beta-phosphoglucomutase-like phosphatase (HAD superfamily)
VTVTRFRGAIFDIDGVLVDSPHEQAWRESLHALMEGEWSAIRARTSWSPGAFTPLVYQQLVAGKPRLDGARAAVTHFGGPDLEARAAECAARKQAMLVSLIERGEFTVFPDALRLLLDMKDRGLLVAAASSSRNTRPMLQRIDLAAFGRTHGISSPTLRPGLTLLDVFDVDVSGRPFEHGKPHPQMFLAAAQELGVEPAAAVVVEDAPAGVIAARSGGMSSIGIARRGDADLLVAAGADLVVTSLDDVDRTAFAAGRLAATAVG